MVKQEHIYWIILALKWFQNLLDIIVDYLMEYKTATGWRKEREKAIYNYESSAQIVTILARGSYTPVWEHGPDNYLYIHDQYTHPNFVLKHDHVTLQGCTPTHVIFAMTKPGVDMYDMRQRPFVMVAQYLEAVKLIFVPLWAYVQLGEELGDPDPDMEVICLINSARSGSTLLTKMFHELPNTVAMSEPWGLHYLHRWYASSRIRDRDYPKYIQALCRLQCKPFNERKVKAMVIKPTEMMTPMHSIIVKVFPKMKMIFNTRHPKQSMISYLHTAQSEKVKPLFKYQYHDFYNACLPFDYDSEMLQELRNKLVRETRITSIVKSFAYKYGGVADFYFRHKDICKSSILFEDILADPEKAVKKLFQALELPVDLVPYALKALKTHSQANFFGDPSKDKREKELDRDDWDEVNEAFLDMNLPLEVNMTMESYKNLF